jgi:hypothetical protein
LLEEELVCWLEEAELALEEVLLLEAELVEAEELLEEALALKTIEFTLTRLPAAAVARVKVVKVPLIA